MSESKHRYDPDRQAIEELWESVERHEAAFARYRLRVNRELKTLAGAVTAAQEEIAALQEQVAVLEQGSGPVAIRFTIGGKMPGQITVDTTDESAEVGFVDDKGDATTAPSGASFSFASSDESVVTVAADADDPNKCDITPVGEGSADVSVSSNGTAFEADGTTPIADPDPVTVTVSAGAAAGESFVLSA